MNYDLIKTTLIEIIKEAQNLPENELERVENTNVYVKKGRTKEFDVNAYYYFEYVNNVKINDQIDYITEVYQTLAQEIKEENEEYYDAKSYEIAASTLEEIKRFKALKGSIASLDSNYEKLARDLQNTLALEYNDTKKERLNKLNEEINIILENKKIINTQLVEIKNNVNAKVKAMVEEQMALIVNDYRTTRRGTKIAFGLDGVSILEKNKDEYDSLYVLSQILNNVKDENLVIVDDFICVNKIQEETVKNLLAKINVFKRLKTKEEVKVEVEKPNASLINRITKVLKGLEIETSEKSKVEYNNLLSILKLLHKAQNSNLALVSVWDTAEVLSEDVPKLKELMNKTGLFKNSNPDLAKKEENAKIIQELEAYLDNLAKKISDYKGVANLPIRQTKQIGDKVWVVAESDLAECNYIIAIMQLLKSANNNLVNVWNIGNVEAKDVMKFKNLVNATKYFEQKVPKINVNETKIAEIKKRLTEMMIKAKDAPKEALTPNSLILASDLEEYNLLKEQYNYLAAAATADDLVEIDGVKMGIDYVDKYKNVLARLEALKNKTKIVDPIPDVVEPVAPIVDEPTISDEPQDVPVSEPIEIVDDAKTFDTALPDSILTDDLEDFDDPDLDSEIVEETTPIEPEVTGSVAVDSNEKPKRKKLIGIRKAKDKALSFIKEHWKVIVALGIAITLISVSLANLPAILIYANSCNALAFPALAGFFNSISSVVAGISGITFSNGAWLTAGGLAINGSAAASNALLASLGLVADLGVITGSVVAAKKAIQKKKAEYEQPEAKKTQAKEAAKSIHQTLKDKWFGLKLGLKNTMDKVNSKIDDLVTKIAKPSAKEEQPAEVLDVDDTKFSEIETAVEEAIAKETTTAEPEVQDRIDRRVRDINQGRIIPHNQVYVEPVLSSDTASAQPNEEVEDIDISLIPQVAAQDDGSKDIKPSPYSRVSYNTDIEENMELEEKLPFYLAQADSMIDGTIPRSGSTLNEDILITNMKNLRNVLVRRRDSDLTSKIEKELFQQDIEKIDQKLEELNNSRGMVR